MMSKHMKIILILGLLVLIDNSKALGGNTDNDSFNKSRKMLANKIYKNLPNETLYCGATFSGGQITNSNGFISSKYKNRAHKLEWEHIVPVENFGRFFSEWRDGHKECVSSDKPFRGRNCANKVSREYRLMASDMYNLYPVIGAINAIRSNYQFAEGVIANDTGNCEVKIADRKIEPKDTIKGIIARTAIYMDKVYEKYRLSSTQKRLFLAWDKLYPVTPNECKRTKLIERLQHNSNRFVKTPCIRAGLW